MIQLIYLNSYFFDPPPNKFLNPCSILFKNPLDFAFVKVEFVWFTELGFFVNGWVEFDDKGLDIVVLLFLVGLDKGLDKDCEDNKEGSVLMVVWLLEFCFIWANELFNGPIINDSMPANATIVNKVL